MLLVGDSTMLQASVTLMSMITTYGGKCASQITFGLSNFVVGIIIITIINIFIIIIIIIIIIAETPGTLIDYVDKVIPDIIIVNFGAWTRDFRQFEGYFNGIMVLIIITIIIILILIIITITIITTGAS